MDFGLLAVLASVIMSGIGMAINASQTRKANKAQAEHDMAMAALNHRYREEEAATSFEREATFNQYSTDVNKMQEAGLSPALMYGNGMSNTTPQISSVGSSQSAGNVGKTFNASDFFGKLDPSEYASQAIERMNAKTMRDKTSSDIQLQNQYRLESISRTLENKRNTAFKKNLEKTMFDIEQQNLRNLKIGNDAQEFDLNFKRDTRELDIEAKQVANSKVRKDIELTVEKIKSEPVARAKLRAEIDEVRAATDNYYANSALLQENLKHGQIGRVMQEFGLNARTLNPMLRNGELINAPYKIQMEGAKLALEQLGFSEFEATNAVVYYMASDPKDVTPSFINGVSRILSKK